MAPWLLREGMGTIRTTANENHSENGSQHGSLTIYFVLRVAR